MNTKLKIFSPIIFALLCVISSYAQRDSGNKTHEIGVMIGSSSFTTDYGQRYTFKSNVGGNVGQGFGIIHYLTFTDYRYRWDQDTNYWKEHFRIRSEISYHKAKLEHFGKWIEASEGVEGEKLKAMHGEAKLWNIGSQLEFHFIDINDFGSRRDLTLKWSPYLSLGFMVNLYDPTVETRYGDGDWENNYDLLFPKWASSQATRDTKGITGSLTAGIGTRKKLGEYSDIFIESRWQYFFSNWVDGLNARDDVANKFNDWLLYVHVGYVYYLN